MGMAGFQGINLLTICRIFKFDVAIIFSNFAYAFLFKHIESKIILLSISLHATKLS